MSNNTFFVLFSLLRYRSSKPITVDFVLKNLEIYEMYSHVKNIEIISCNKAVLSFNSEDDAKYCIYLMDDCSYEEQRIPVARLRVIYIGTEYLRNGSSESAKTTGITLNGSSDANKDILDPSKSTAIAGFEESTVSSPSTTQQTSVSSPPTNTTTTLTASFLTHEKSKEESGPIISDITDPLYVPGSATKTDKYLQFVKETTSAEVTQLVYNLENYFGFILEVAFAQHISLMEVFPAVDQRTSDSESNVNIKLVVLYQSHFNNKVWIDEHSTCGGHVHWVWVSDSDRHATDDPFLKLDETDWISCCETIAGRAVCLTALRAFCDSTVADFIDQSADTTMVMPSVTPLSSAELDEIDNNSAVVGFKRCIKVSKKAVGFCQLLMDPVTGTYSLPPLPPTTVTLTNGEEVPVVYDEQYVDPLRSDLLRRRHNPLNFGMLPTPPRPHPTDQTYQVRPNDSIGVLGSSGSYGSIGGVVYRGKEAFLVVQSDGVQKPHKQHLRSGQHDAAAGNLHFKPPFTPTLVDYCIPSAEHKKANLLWCTSKGLFNDHGHFTESLDSMLVSRIYQSTDNWPKVAKFLRVEDSNMALNALTTKYLAVDSANTLKFRVSSQDIVHGTDLELSLSGGKVTIESSAVSATLPVGGNLSFLPLKPTSLVGHFVNFPAKGKRIVGTKTLADLLFDSAYSPKARSFGEMEVIKVGASMGLGSIDTCEYPASIGTALLTRPAHVKVHTQISHNELHSGALRSTDVCGHTLYNQLLIEGTEYKGAFMRQGDGCGAVYCDAVRGQSAAATDILMVGNAVALTSAGFTVVTPADYVVGLGFSWIPPRVTVTTAPL